ncbi:hypothetical protein OIU84_026820 [Salix udensis]|uniref:Endonuclease/exonuclease/phosphatase domain-containing protein n=1 Tax=Salix udensis TaxID=889485 RepID=A0AAD6NNS8_9ROSI|nr:hypothetical protein OIU84_026820 [Salix udensis]
MHAELDATTVNKGKGHAPETLVGEKAIKSHETSQGYLERTESKMDSLQSQSQGTICSASSSTTADSSSSMDANQGHYPSQQDRTNKVPPPNQEEEKGKEKAGVQEWARKDNLDILGIIEPRLGSNKFSEISARMGLQGWLSADNGVIPNKCRILMTWNPAKLMVQILDQAPQWLVCETTMLASNKKLLITFIHGFNTPAERVQLWDHLMGRCSVNNLVPWLAIGDFNAILSGEDRVGGSQRWPQHMEDFPVCIQQAGLSSIPYTGLRFTWSNGQTGSNSIQKKLDWALANSALLQAWPAAHANFLPRLVSDHSPMTINLAQESKARNKPFRFLNLWTDRDDFSDMVNGVWNQPVHGNPLYRFTTKLQIMRSTLRRYHNQTTSHISSRVADAKRKWIKGQLEMDARPRDSQLQAQERILAENYNRLYKEEESFFKQRSRIQWLELGDRNTSFFHKSLQHRRSRNKIHRLSTPDGTWEFPTARGRGGGYLGYVPQKNH